MLIDTERIVSGHLSARLSAGVEQAQQHLTKIQHWVGCSIATEVQGPIRLVEAVVVLADGQLRGTYLFAEA